MIRKLWKRASVAALSFAAAVAALGGCSTPQFNSYDEAAWAGAMCVDRGWTRVPDNYCPIGDEPAPNHPFFWAYRPYNASTPDVDIVYVGYPVDRHVWVNTRPARVSTLHIDRGSYPERPAAGSAPATSVRVPTAPVRQKTSTITRGGLGTPGARATNAPAPKPGAASAAAPKALPKAPASRPMAPTGASIKSGRK
jgi:hypothetical protein